ncbi:MAG TPA: alpha/beta hydrolase [Thermoanaerobaculia bacterium]|nr:alpha/beta hydrolase [Thermoanaerobaculia bacterium]
MHTDLSLRYVLKVPTAKPDSAEMPLVLCMHGRGADANDLADLAPMLDGGDGYRFIFPNAPRPFEPYPGMTFGWTWFDGLPPDPESIAAARATLLRFIDEVLARYPTPEGKVVVSGFSQGGVMALEAGFRMPVPPAGIVVMSGALHERDLPDLRARANQRVLIVHGTFDDMIPVAAARRARHVLEEHGLRPEYHEFAMGHQVTQESLSVVADFIRRCLG